MPCNIATEFTPPRTTSMVVADWEKAMAINMSAPFYLSQAAIPYLLQTNGIIINVASSVVNMAVLYTAAYAASKAGLVHMTKAMAKEYIDDPTRINAIAPAGFPPGPRSQKPLSSDIDPKEFQRTPSTRDRLEVVEVAELIACLASDAAKRYYGSCITNDNGISLG